MNNLRAKIILITGGSRGIGLAIAQACASEGAQTLLVARHRAALERARLSVPGAIALPADVTRAADLARLFKSVAQRFDRLDVLVNNAGVFTFKPFVRTSLADWEKNLRSNLTSLFLVTRAALPLLDRSRSPQIVNILSVSSRSAFPNCSAYSASKFGALGFTRVLAKELPRIRVTAVLPGATNTRMADEFNFPIDRSKLLRPEDVARSVVSALVEPAHANIQEILLTPSAGDFSRRPRTKKK
ncbi:MAG: SDR family oxidoreductase [Terriglobia bacterium]